MTYAKTLGKDNSDVAELPMTAELISIPVDLIDDHPDNPRILFREDVIVGISANLNGEYPQKHALHVRPVGERYQLLAGHHRIRAARARGFSHVWAWVEPLDDEKAFMELATSNNQGELAPLEIGIHAIKAVPLGKRGRGNRGDGLTAYAKKLGKDQSRISRHRQAAEVLLSLENHAAPHEFLDKADHLSFIHSADRRVWPECVETMLAAGWTAKDTEHWVGKVRDICQTIDGIGEEWEDVFLDRVAVVKRFLATKEFSARTVAALGAKAA